MSASSPERLAEWISASPEARSRALAKCLETIALKDPRIHAWVQVSPQSATETGPLSGIPFGAKDIIDTRGLVTEYGSAIYRGRVGVEDADIIAELKDRGAILIGKTQTTAFAYMTPGPTRNPRNVEHTPGGSSSGSAAAVAAGMVPLALGTADKGLGAEAGVVLWRHRVQANVRCVLNERRAAVRQEPRYPRLLHAHAR